MRASNGRNGDLFLTELRVLDQHVFEFAGLKDLSTLFALDVFRVLVAGDNLHTRVLARLSWLFRGSGRRRDWSHKSGLRAPYPGGKGKTPEIGRILKLSEAVVKSLPHKEISHSIPLFVPSGLKHNICL